jgi:glycosyltransferase involved in cell wall biosynthesis
MHVWVIKDGENFPIQPNARRMRTWMLADALLDRGHEVTWWASTFSHQRKTLLATKDSSFPVSPGFEMKLLHAGTYTRHASLDRYRHHERLAERFARVSRVSEQPDLIVCAFPIIHLAYEAVRYSTERGVPIIIDVRDLWPDSIVSLAPAPLRAIARFVLRRDFQMTKQLLGAADGIAAVSDHALRWALRMAGREKTPTDRVFYIGYPRSETTQEPSSEKIQMLAESARGKTIFCFAGSVGHAWDLELVCRAAKILAARADGNGVHFALAGGGPGAPAVEAAAARLHNLTWLGWLDRTELAQLLELSHVGLAPHRMKTEALPNKVFEYLAAGLPLLSSLHGEPERLIRDEQIGCNYKSGDVRQFVKLALWFAANPAERTAMRERAVAVANTQYRNEANYVEYAQYAERIAQKMTTTPETAA